MAMNQAFIQFLAIVIDYGFTYTATRRIAVHRDAPSEIAKIFKIVQVVKILLLLLVLPSSYLILINLDIYHSHRSVFLLAYVGLIGQALYPQWYFQGLEKIDILTAINIASKLLCVVGMFSLVHTPSDVDVALALQSTMFALPGVLAFVLALRAVSVFDFPKLAFSDIVYELREGWRIFSTTLIGNTYGQGSVLIVGELCGASATGSFALAQKISSAVSGLAAPFCQALYPRQSHMLSTDRNKYIRQRKIIIQLGAVISAILATLLLVFAENILNLISNQSTADVLLILRIYSLTTFVVTLNVVLNIFLGAEEAYTYMQKMYFRAAMTFFIVAIPGTYYLGVVGMAIGLLVIEISILISSAAYVLKTRHL